MTEFDARIALLWQEILQCDQSDTFAGALKYGIKRLHGFDGLPQPGLVGSRYRPGGVLLLGQNPGNDSVGKGNSTADNIQYELLGRLKNTSDAASAIAASHDLMTALTSKVMPTWPIIRNICHPLLASLGLELQDVAYINLVKFRTSSSKFGSAIYKASWDLTSRQIDLLAPKYVIALGVETHRQFTRLYQGHSQIFRVTRAIGDTRLPSQGKADIKYIAEQIGTLRA